MSVIRVKKAARKPYVIVDITALNDARLSFRAKGLHTYLMSKPDDWQVFIEQLEKESPKEGRDAIRAALKELEDCGYITRTRARGAKGRLAGWETEVYETPALAQAEHPEQIGLAETSPPKSAQPKSAQPKSAQPKSANPQLLNIDLTQDLKEPKIEETPPLPPRGARRAKTATTPAPRKTAMPTDPAQQEQLRVRILDPAFHAWMQKKRLTYDVDDQWESFVRAALAKGYRYADWRAAFQNWLTSPYQEQARSPTTGANPLDGYLSPKGQRSVANAQRLLEDIDHAESGVPAFLTGPQRPR